MNNFKISVIVPIYNVEQYLKKCLDSLVNQTIKDEIEIICINDCSPDNCLKILNEYQNKYGKELIKIIDHKENTGVGIARNDGMNIASGEYIGFVDPDDWVDLDFFEKLYNKAKETNADMVRGNVKEISDNIADISIEKERLFNIATGDIFRSGFWSFIYKNKSLKENNIEFPNLRNCQDIVFLFYSLLLLKNIVSINNTFYYYFRRKNSSTDGLSKTRIICEIKKDQMIIDTMNKVNISNDFYINVFQQLFLSNIYRFNKCEEIYNKYYQNIVLKNMIDIYEKCKYKEEYYNKYYNKYLDYLENKDFINLKRILLNNYYGNTEYYSNIKYSILGIPFIAIKYFDNKKSYLLFNFLPLITIIKRNQNKIRYKLFNLINLLIIRKK